jgi:hypothetical protein
LRRIKADKKIGERRFAGARGPGNPNDAADLDDQIKIAHSTG